MQIALDTLQWYHVTFTFKIYLGEDEWNADDKVKMSLRNFPLLIHDFHIKDREIIDTEQGMRMKLALDLGIKPDADIDDVARRFDCVTHLHNYTIQPIEEEA